MNDKLKPTFASVVGSKDSYHCGGMDAAASHPVEYFDSCSPDGCLSTSGGLYQLNHNALGLSAGDSLVASPENTNFAACYPLVTCKSMLSTVDPEVKCMVTVGETTGKNAILSLGAFLRTSLAPSCITESLGKSSDESPFNSEAPPYGGTVPIFHCEQHECSTCSLKTIHTEIHNVLEGPPGTQSSQVDKVTSSTTDHGAPHEPRLTEHTDDVGIACDVMKAAFSYKAEMYKNHVTATMMNRGSR